MTLGPTDGDPDPTLDDAAGRQVIRCSLDESLLVEAAAGTGKTSELIRRLVNVLEEGRAEVGGIVAVTFTRKAAGELKLRLRQALDRARTDAPSAERRSNLERAIAHLEEARIGTIHAFCAEILRERPVEARVDPSFEELNERDSRRLYDRAFRRWLEEGLIELPEALRRALSRPDSGWDRKTAAERLAEDGWTLVQWRDFTTPWRREPFSRTAEIDRLLELVETVSILSTKAKHPTDPLAAALEPARELSRRIARTDSGRGTRDYEALEAELIALLTELKNRNRTKKSAGYGLFAEGVLREALVEKRDALIADLAAFERRANADLAAALQGELFRLGARYAELKERGGKLDFADLLIKVRDLLRDDAGVRQWFQAKLSHIFVDEFQDTDPLQTEILLLLAADDPRESDWTKARPIPGKLFLVGDPKQSIYRFRRADVVVYQSVKAQLASMGVRIVHLSESYRAVLPIQRAVNAAFEPVMKEDLRSGQPAYVPLAAPREERAITLVAPDSPLAPPPLVALSVPVAHGSARRVRNEAVNACLPATVAAFIAWMLKSSGWTVRDSDDPNKRVPIRPRHIAILFRRFMSGSNDMARPYVQELEQRSLPHLLVGGRSFHHREEVESMRAALAAIEWPDDELSVYATLKGPLFAIPDQTLFRFRQEHKRLHPFRPLPAELGPDLAPIKEALLCLKELHRRRNHRPIVETLNELLDRTRAHAGFALRKAGPQVLASVQRVLDLARSFEVGGGLSFRGFVEDLDRESENEKSTEAPLLEESADGVRIMTVYSAKGLEFPIVILGDMTARRAPMHPSRFLDSERGLFATKLVNCQPLELQENAELEIERDQAEGARIAYVAATRAKDVLVIPAIGTGPREGWFDVLNRAIYPPGARWQKAEPAPACPAFGTSTIRSAASFGEAIAPGLHRFDDRGYSVVWWDPSKLELTAHPTFGLVQELLLVEKQGPAEESNARYQAWHAERRRTLELGRRPILSPFAASEPGAPAPPANEAPIEELVLPRNSVRPGGPRFGTLVHTILRDVPFDADPGAVRALAELHGRLLGATEDEIRAAAAPVSALLGHALIARAQRAARCHRELPVLLRTDSDALLDGTIDLAFLEDRTWTVVDFKTDADLSARRAHYRKQLEWYLAAMSRSSGGGPVRGILLRM